MRSRCFANLCKLPLGIGMPRLQPLSVQGEVIARTLSPGGQPLDPIHQILQRIFALDGQLQVTPGVPRAPPLEFNLEWIKAISIERAPSDAINSVTINNDDSPPPSSKAKSEKVSAKKEKPKPEKSEKPTIPNEKIIEGSILMIDGDFYVMRGERGEIRVERTPDTKVTEEFKFGDRIRATVLKNDKALKIERAP